MRHELQLRAPSLARHIGGNVQQRPAYPLPPARRVDDDVLDPRPRPPAAREVGHDEQIERADDRAVATGDKQRARALGEDLCERGAQLVCDGLSAPRYPRSLSSVAICGSG